MTEFDVGGATLGLIPGTAMEALLAGQVRMGSGQRCEVYLRGAEAAAALERASGSGGTLLAPIRQRSWGERVGYVLDRSRTVLARRMSLRAQS